MTAALVDAGRTRPTSRSHDVVLGLLVLAFVAVALWHAGRSSVTVDEAVDLAAGLAIVDQGELGFAPEHGLIQRAAPAVFPWLLAQPVVPDRTVSDSGDWFTYTGELIAENIDHGRLDEVLLWFRVVPIALAAATGVLLHRLGRELVDDRVGLLAAGLWLTTPYVLGLAHVSSIDVIYTFAVVFVSHAALRAWRSPSDGRVAILVLALVVALLVRHQAVVLIPVAAVVVGLALRRCHAARGASRVAAVLIAPLIGVWATFVLLRIGGGVAYPERLGSVISAAADEGIVGRAGMALPLPTEWRAGLGYLILTSEPKPAYLLGQLWEGSRPWFFLGSALIKVPLTATAAFIAGAFAWWRVRGLPGRDLGVVGSFFAAHAVFLHLQPLNLGLRLALPLLAFAALIAGGLTAVGHVWIRRSLLIAVAAGQLAASVAAIGMPLAWTPPPFGDGYRHVSDSSIDLGQANDAVAERHADEPFRAVSLLAPRGYGVRLRVPRVEDVDPATLVGTIAVSATVLTTIGADELSWLRAYCPVDVLHGSVLIYRFTEPPQPELSLDRPRAPCPAHSTGSARRGG